MDAEQILKQFSQRQKDSEAVAKGAGRLALSTANNSSLTTLTKAPSRPVVSIDAVFGGKSQLQLDERFTAGGELAMPFSLVFGSVDLMDAFEAMGADGRHKYRRLVLERVMMSHSKVVGLVSFDLLVERLHWNESCRGDVTFTELRRDCATGLAEYIYEVLEGKAKCQKLRQGDIFIFDEPYLLRAQNSGNLMPGGWEYGTKYGETTRYGVIGVRLS